MQRIFRKSVVGVICILLLLVTMIITPEILGEKAHETRAYQLPVWKSDDWWKYYYHSDEPLFLDSGDIQVTIDEITTVEVLTVAGSESVMVNGTSYDIYNVTIEGNIAQKGSYVYGQYSGPYTDNSESTGFAYYRRSDLAFIKRVDDITGTITMTIMGSPQNSPYTSTVLTNMQPPREDFNFPMSHLSTWNVNSLQTVNQTFSSQGQTESVETHTLFSYIATVGAEDKGEVAGRVVDFYPIHGVGTAVGGGNTAPFEVYNNYSSVVKNSIIGLIGFGDVDSPPGSGDLTIDVEDFLIAPQSPREGVRANISCEISNVGYGNVAYPRVRAELDGDTYGEDIIIDMIESYGKYTIYYDIVPLDRGSHSFEIILDPDNLIEESDETNNGAVFTFEVAANKEPLITGYQPFTNIIINKGSTAVFEIVASDPDGDKINYEWTVDGGTVSGANGPDCEIAFTGVDEGDELVVKAVVYDDFNANVSHEWGVTINTAPTITGHTPPEQMITTLEGEEVDFVITYDNAGEESIIFRWYLDDDLLHWEKAGFFTFEAALSGANSSEGSPYEIKVVVEDFLNLTDEYSWTLQVDNMNQAPQIINAFAGGAAREMQTINETENMNYNITALDPDNDALTYTWFVDGQEITGAKAADFIYTTDKDTVTHLNGRRTQDFIIKVLCDDGELNDTFTWILRVVDINRAPIISFEESLDSALSGIKEGEMAALNVSSEDSDGDVMTYQWLLDGEILAVDPSFTISFKEGDHTIQLLVDDGYDKTRTEIFNFTILPGETGPGNSGNTDGSKGGKGIPLWAVIVIVLVVLVVIMVIILLIKRKKPVAKVSFEGVNEHKENVIFLCPKCNEKEDLDLGYCISCGNDFSHKK